MSAREKRRSARAPRGPNRPYQFARMAAATVGWGTSAGVHSTVWIFAITAAVIRRAVSKSRWSVQSGCRAASMSQTALCSRAKSVCITERPAHQLPLTPVRSTPLRSSTGSSPSSPILRRPPRPSRSRASRSGVLP